VIVDFTLAPKNAHPGILMEALDVYTGLLERGYKPEHIATIGDSAGGNLSAALVLYAAQLGYPLPAACVGLCPWYDMACTSESLTTNADKDGLISKEVLSYMAEMFLGGKSPTGPLANPLHANLKNFPPTLIQVGGNEGLLDDSRKFYDKAKKEGVDVELQVFPEMQHIFHGMAGKAPEADDAVAKVGQWLRPRLGLA
jgi:acetyl esterase/lipase